MTVLGLDLFTLEVTTEGDDESTDPGDCLTTPIGFAPSAGDQQRWRLAEVPELS